MGTFASRTFELPDNPYPNFLPLQVGNQWTYEHVYWNYLDSYFHLFDGFSPLQQTILQIVFGHIEEEIITKRFTIEIVRIGEGPPPYYVFSDVDYDWPPVPNFFFAGKKVSYEGDFEGTYSPYSLYRFSPHHLCPYLVPNYPLLDDQNQRGTLEVMRELSYADNGLIGAMPSRPPASLSQEAVASFRFSSEGINLGEVWFVSGYGLVSYDLWVRGYGYDVPFNNSIIPVSAVIDGKEIEYPLKARELTHVQPTSWGQLKAHYGQEP